MKVDKYFISFTVATIAIAASAALAHSLLEFYFTQPRGCFALNDSEKNSAHCVSAISQRGDDYVGFSPLALPSGEATLSSWKHGNSRTRSEVRQLNKFSNFSRRFCETKASSIDGSFEIKMLGEMELCWGIWLDSAFNQELSEEVLKFEITFAGTAEQLLQIKPVVLLPDVSQVLFEDSSAWSYFSPAFHYLFRKGDLVLVNDDLKFIYGVDQPEKLSLDEERSIFHGVGSWPGLGSVVTILHNAHYTQQKPGDLQKFGLPLASKLSAQGNVTKLEFTYLAPNLDENIYGLYLSFIGWKALKELKVVDARVFLPESVEVPHKLVVVSGETYNKIMLGNTK
jgi:hypothetical protein